MNDVVYIDRKTREKHVEKVYHQKSLHFLYENNPLSRFLLFIVAKNPLFSKLFGWLQNLSCSKKKIAPFIEKYGVDKTEFLKNVEDFRSFNDFFCRKLKTEARPIANGAIIPADGRFLFYQNIDTCDGFVVKGKKFTISQLLNNERLAKKYAQGSMVIGRLCPSDYHRFHFPDSCIPGKAHLINGPLYSVNPVAVKQNIELLAENKRMITELKTDHFGNVLHIEIGATCVGSIHQTYVPQKYYKKGEEKGFFSFGGSSIILLFEQNQIQFDSDLLSASSQHIEILCHMGQSMGNKKGS